MIVDTRVLASFAQICRNTPTLWPAGLAPDVNPTLVRLQDQGGDELASGSQVVRFLRQLVRQPDHERAEMTWREGMTGAVRSLVRHADHVGLDGASERR
jgi:hypothetical protein